MMHRTVDGPRSAILYDLQYEFPELQAQFSLHSVGPSAPQRVRKVCCSSEERVPICDVMVIRWESKLLNGC
jgi:hypothetical protein